MTATRNDPDRTGIRFFGEITTALSHDLKNVLAIINENAGLLDDFIFMAKNGRPIDPERLKNVTGKIRKQVARADKMIKRLNKVGHSADQAVATIDLGELTETVCGLAERKATMGGVALSIDPSPDPVRIKSDPFVLQQLIWECLDAAIQIAEASGSVRITLTATKNGATIVFDPVEKIRKEPVDPGPGWLPKEVSDKINAEIVLNRKQGSITIQLPLEIAE